MISILIISFRFIMFRVLTSFNNTSTLDVCPSQTAANKGVMLCLSVCCKSNSFHYKIRGCIYIHFKVITKCNKFMIIILLNTVSDLFYSLWFQDKVFQLLQREYHLLMHLSKPRNFGLLKAIGAEINLQSSKADSNHNKLRIFYLNGRNHCMWPTVLILKYCIAFLH